MPRNRAAAKGTKGDHDGRSPMAHVRSSSLRVSPWPAGRREGGEWRPFRGDGSLFPGARNARPRDGVRSRAMADYGEVSRAAAREDPQSQSRPRSAALSAEPRVVPGNRGIAAPADQGRDASRGDSPGAPRPLTWQG